MSARSSAGKRRRGALVQSGIPLPQVPAGECRLLQVVGTDLVQLDACRTVILEPVREVLVQARAFPLR